jgi:hypothetical protein
LEPRSERNARRLVRTRDRDIIESERFRRVYHKVVEAIAEKRPRDDRRDDKYGEQAEERSKREIRGHRGCLRFAQMEECVAKRTADMASPSSGFGGRVHALSGHVDRIGGLRTWRKDLSSLVRYSE